MKIGRDTRVRPHVLDNASVIELWHDFANGGRAGNAGWHGKVKLTGCGRVLNRYQESAPNASGEQFTAINEDLRVSNEQAGMPNRWTLAGIIIRWQFFAGKLNRRPIHA
jgi:hypothetical protein